MKRCPTCNRTYAEDAQKFCLDDGATLIEESATPFDPQATIALPGSQQTTPTANPYGSGAGQGSYGSGAGQSNYGSSSGQSSYGSGAGQSSYGAGAGQQASPSWTPTPQPYAAQAAKKRSILPWVLGGGAVLLVGGIGLIIVIAVLVSSSNSNNSNNRSNSNSNSSSYTSNSNRSNSNSSSQYTNVITSDDGKTQISAPSTWKKMTGLNEKADLQASDSVNEKYLIVLSENKADFGRNIDLNAYANITLKNLIKSMTSSNQVGPTRLTINGSPAVQYEISGEVNNLNAVYLHTTVETSKHFHQIVVWTTQTTYEQNKDQLQEIIQSFKEK